MNWITEHYIEVTAAILGITGVFLTTRQNIWCWPIGLLNVTLSIYVFFIEKLYADVILQFFYLGMTLYGWYNWIFGGKKKYELPVRRIKGREVSVMLIIGIIFSFAMGYIIANYTDAAYPYWDSNLTVWGIIATYAMAKKILAHWLMWIIIDINCTALYFIKQMYAFSPLYFIFTLLAVYGYFQWKKDYKTEYSV